MVIETVWRSMVIKKHEQIEALWHPQSFRCNDAPDGIVSGELIHLHNIIIFINDIIYFSTAVALAVYRQKFTNALYIGYHSGGIPGTYMYRVEFMLC